jgi:hypothetical protein
MDFHNFQSLAFIYNTKIFASSCCYRDSQNNTKIIEEKMKSKTFIIVLVASLVISFIALIKDRTSKIMLLQEKQIELLEKMYKQPTETQKKERIETG